MPYIPYIHPLIYSSTYPSTLYSLSVIFFFPSHIYNSSCYAHHLSKVNKGNWYGLFRERMVSGTCGVDGVVNKWINLSRKTEWEFQNYSTHGIFWLAHFSSQKLPINISIKSFETPQWLSFKALFMQACLTYISWDLSSFVYMRHRSNVSISCRFRYIPEQCWSSTGSMAQSSRIQLAFGFDRFR